MGRHETSVKSWLMDDKRRKEANTADALTIINNVLRQEENSHSVLEPFKGRK